MSRFLNTKPVTSEGLHKFLSFTLAPVIQTMDDAVGIAMVFYGSLVDDRLKMPYFILSSLEISVWKCYDFVFHCFCGYRRSAGSFLQNNCLVIFRGKNGSFTFCARDKFMSTRKLALVIQNTLN